MSGYVNPVSGRPTPRVPADLAEQVARALAEDVGAGDATAALVDPEGEASAVLTSRDAGVLCGIPWFEEVFLQLGDGLVVTTWMAREGDAIAPGQMLCTLDGPARPILTGERTALNFLQTLSATATAARTYAEAVAGTGARILDTRKTLPGLRAAQKYAVRCGGGHNHRMGLDDAVLIKENHIAAAGSITAAVAAARARSPGLTVEVEVEDQGELEEALAAGADLVMLDNFGPDDLERAVARTGGRARLEVSGNMDPDQARAAAAAGVDFVSVGALTKHVRALDLSLRLV